MFAVFGYVWLIFYFAVSVPSFFLGIGPLCTLISVMVHTIIYKEDAYFIHWETKIHSRLLAR